MHINQFQLYTFIDSFNKNKILKFDKNCCVIFRNYEKKIELNTIVKIRNICKKKNLKFYLANNLKIAIKANLDGIYLPSFNKKLNLKNFQKRKHFKIIGSAHNIHELKIKEKQGVDIVFLSPLFQTKNYKKYLDIIRFNILCKETKKKTIALGGIRKKNISKLKMTNVIGFSGITYFN
tara:strand:+ start:801 stop:1334 length:534 start_codon:yes stop_codon:yes gene_type:complete